MQQYLGELDLDDIILIHFNRIRNRLDYSATQIIGA